MRYSAPTAALAALCGAFVLASPLSAQRPAYEVTGTWVSIDGTVAEVLRNQITLDYGDGFVTVQVDDGEPDTETDRFSEGDAVTVTGRIRDDFYQAATIEASSIYVEDAGTWFFTSASPGEGPRTATSPQVDPSRTVLQGEVTEVGPGEFTLDRGGNAVTVDVSELDYDPFDPAGRQQIEVGDIVSVSGMVDAELFEAREMTALTVTELRG